MNEFEEVFEEYDSKENYTKEEYAEYKKNEKASVYRLIDTTAEKIVSNSEDFKRYLDVQSNFENYSVGNSLLIAAQMPSATQVRDYDSWNKVGNVAKKSKGIKILEPAEEYMREDGTIGRNFNVKNVFDVSQVNLKQQMSKPMRYNDRILLKIFLSSSKSKITPVNEIPNSDRMAKYNAEENVLYIARGAETPKIFHEVAEELAKQELGENNEFTNFKAYCVSYMMCKKYGVDVSNYKFDKIPERLKVMEAKEIRSELEPMRNAVESINSRMSDCIQRLTMESRENNEKNKARER